MRLLLDQGLPRSTVQHLAGMGITANHVGDLGMARASDAQILDEARQCRAAVVSLDADFHALLAESSCCRPVGRAHPHRGPKRAQLASLLAQVLDVAGAEIEAGAVMTVSAGRIRVRLLPIGR